MNALGNFPALYRDNKIPTLAINPCEGKEMLLFVDFDYFGWERGLGRRAGFFVGEADLVFVGG